MIFEQRKQERQALSAAPTGTRLECVRHAQVCERQNHWQAQRQQTPAQLLEQSGPRDLWQSR